MRIRFTYDGKRRSGELARFYTAGNGAVIAKVKEDGIEFPKSFRVDLMGSIESGPVRTDEEMLPLLKLAAEKWLRREVGRVAEYAGNPLELLVSAAFQTNPSDAIRDVGEAMECILREAQ